MSLGSDLFDAVCSAGLLPAQRRAEAYVFYAQFMPRGALVFT